MEIHTYDTSQRAVAASKIEAAIAQAGIYGFTPAFYNSKSGDAVFARSASGYPVPTQSLGSVPGEWLNSRGYDRKVHARNEEVVPGYVRDGYFFTHDRAAAAIEREKTARNEGSAYYDCF